MDARVLLSFLVLAPATASDSPPGAVALDSTTGATAQEIVRESAEALGGMNRLQAIAALRVEEEGQEFLLTVPSDPSGPRRFTTERIVTLWRSDPLATRRTVDQAFSMRPGRYVQTIVTNDSVAAVQRSGSLTSGTRYDLETANTELALAPHRLLLTALASPALHLDADTSMGGSRFHRVSFPVRSGQVQLLIDAVTSFPHRVRFTRAYPDLVYWAMWGQVTIETIWSSWSREANGVWYPRQRDETMNGRTWRQFIVTQLDVAPAVPADSFAIPDSVITRFLQQAGPLSSPAPMPKLEPATLADGIVLFHGGYQSALVRTASGVVVIEAPESDAKSRAVLAQADSLFPRAPILAVITTSPQWMHIGGLVEYARRGIPVYALDVNGAEIASLLSAPRDRPLLPAATRAPRLRLVGHRVALGSGDNRMELVPARGIHGVAMLFVYWPARRLLYASDMIIPPSFEPTFTSAYETELQRAVARLGLDVDTVYGLHVAPRRFAPRE